MRYGFPGIDDLLLELVKESVVLLGVGLVVLSVLVLLLSLHLDVAGWLEVVALGHVGMGVVGNW